METMEKEHTEHALAAHLVCVNHRGSKVLLVLLQSVITALTLPISNFAIPPLVLSAGEPGPQPPAAKKAKVGMLHCYRGPC